MSKIGFKCWEHIGFEVFLYPEGDFKIADLKPITERDALQPGVQILVPGFMGDYHLMVVGEGGFAKGGHTGASLVFGEDDRKAWVCTGLINLRGLEKL